MFLSARLLSRSSGPSVILLGFAFVVGLLVGMTLKTSLPPGRAPDEAMPVDRPIAESRVSSWQELRLAPGRHPAEVLRVNDGDTFEARVHVWPGMQVTTKVRLRGIDAAESNARCDEEYRLATAARDALQKLLAEGGVTIAQIGFDKYGGRVLATAATRTTPDISEALLKTGLVRSYEGGRRESWCGQSAGR
jgi:endonuclease YncB( thermonuclease family)